MNASPKLIDIPGSVLAQLDQETREDVRQRLIDEVMEQHQVVSSAWSLIDGPFAGEDSIHEHGRLLHEFQNMIGRVVHLPDSVEGLRFLEKWYTSRIEQLRAVKDAIRPGVVIRLENDGTESTEFELNEDMAKGMRVALTLVQSLFVKFPVGMELTPAPYAPDSDEGGV